jgi:hypothetical protein
MKPEATTSPIERASYMATGGIAECELSFGPKASVLATDDQAGYTAVFHDSIGRTIGHVTIKFDAACRPHLEVVNLAVPAHDIGSSQEGE